MAKYKDFPLLDSAFPTGTPGSEFAIEKIGNREKKDIRTSGATFGILQHMDESFKEVGRLRRRAMAQAQRELYESKKLFGQGESGIYPGVTALTQRDVRQMRKAKPGVTPRPERFA